MKNNEEFKTPDRDGQDDNEEEDNFYDAMETLHHQSFVQSSHVSY